MDNCINLQSLPLFFLIILFSNFLISTFQENHVLALITNDHKLIFNQCLNQTASPSHDHSVLSSLFQEFIAKSSKFKFYKTLVGDEKTTISGTFQCRNDLSPKECTNCVSKFEEFSNNLCGGSMPARIQLYGCYTHYQEEVENTEESAYGDDSRLDKLLHKSCSKHRVKKNEFEEVRYAAFGAMKSCLVSGNGFCELTYENFHVFAQCREDWRSCDCGECAKNAVEIVEDECKYSISGEVYMEGCFVSYKYGGEHGFGGYSFDRADGGTSPKVIAIVIGGLAALLLVLGLCYMVGSCGKKKDDW